MNPEIYELDCMNSLPSVRDISTTLLCSGLEKELEKMEKDTDDHGELCQT
ncbi:MAG: hypothetical protein QXN34_07600 [Archaeoglobaceae archaeon]